MSRPAPRPADGVLLVTPSARQRPQTLADGASVAITTAAAAIRTVARVLLKDHSLSGALRSAPEPPNSAQPAQADQVVELVYELLDAHSDTAKLAAASSVDRSWDAHLDYLRRLQRKGRELLAQTSGDRSG